MTEDYYTTLGVHRNASPEEIQAAYHELARKHHPDLNPDDPEAESNFQEVQSAFEVLSDPRHREIYNRSDISYKTMRAIPRESSELQRVPLPSRSRWVRDPCAFDLILRPAIVLLLVGIIGIPLNLRMTNKSIESTRKQISEGEGDYEQLSSALTFYRVLVAVQPIFGVLQLVGVINMITMRIYPLAALGCIITMIPFVGPCCGLGFIVGIWGLMALNDRMVRDTFWF